MPNKAGQATEAEIQKQIIEYLQLTGWFVFKIHQSLGSYKGIADLYACKNSKSVWIEVKTPRGTQSDYQKQFESDLSAQKISYMVARDVYDVKSLNHRLSR